MMKTKFFSFSVFIVILLAVIFALSPLTAGAVQQTAASTTAPKESNSVVYTDPSTKFNVVIQDDCGLLTEDERKKLAEDMKPLTKYVNAVYFSTDAYDDEGLKKLANDRGVPLNYSDMYGVILDMKGGQMWQDRQGKAVDLISSGEKDTIFSAVKGWLDRDKYPTLKTAFSLANTALSNGADELPEETAAPTQPAPEALSYENPETKYRAVIIDNENLMTEEERSLLIRDMIPLTEYGSVAFWSTKESASDEIDQARLKRRELFGLDSAVIFAINMKERKLTVQSIGAVNEYVTDSKARSITDNVKRYASSKDYYKAASEAYGQMLTLIEGGIIPEPMKYTGYAVLALIAGLICALAFIFSKKANPLIEDTQQFMDKPGAQKNVCQNAKVKLVTSDRELGFVPKLFFFIFDLIFGSIGAAFRGGGSGGGSGCGSSGCGSSGCGSSGCGSSGCGSSGCGSSGGGGGCGSGGSSSF